MHPSWRGPPQTPPCCQDPLPTQVGPQTDRGRHSLVLTPRDTRVRFPGGQSPRGRKPFTAAPLYLQARLRNPGARMWVHLISSTSCLCPIKRPQVPGFLGLITPPNIPQVRTLGPEGQRLVGVTQTGAPVGRAGVGCTGLVLAPQFPPLTKRRQRGDWGAEPASDRAAALLLGAWRPEPGPRLGAAWRPGE